MKRFLRHLVLFFLLLTPLLGLLPLTAWKEWRVYRQALTLPPGTTVVACGHSYEEVSLNPKHFPGLFNICQSGTHIDTTTAKVADLLDQNPDLRDVVLLLDVTPTMAMQGPIEDDLRRRNFVLWMHNPSLRFLPLSYIASRIRYLPGKKTFLVGGFFEHTKQGFLTHPDKAQADYRHRIALLNAYGSWLDKESHYLHRIRALAHAAQAHGMRPILLTTPLYNGVKEWNPTLRKSYLEAIAALAQNLNCPWLNHLDHPYPDTHWGDTTHLNCHAAPDFSHLIHAEIEAWKRGDRANATLR